MHPFHTLLFPEGSKALWPQRRPQAADARSCAEGSADILTQAGGLIIRAGPAFPTCSLLTGKRGDPGLIAASYTSGPTNQTLHSARKYPRVLEHGQEWTVSTQNAEAMPELLLITSCPYSFTDIVLFGFSRTEAAYKE